MIVAVTRALVVFAACVAAGPIEAAATPDAVVSDVKENRTAAAANPTGATDTVTPAPGPATPPTKPAGFGGLVVPGAILLGIGIAVSAGQDDLPSAATGTGTGTR